jgi:hypothetical protein
MNNRKNSGILLTFLFIFLTTSLLFCQKDKFTYTTDEIEQWFLNPSRPLTLKLAEQPINMIDSLICIIHNNHAAGASDDTLSDSLGNRYITGLCTPHTFRYDTLYPLVIYLHGGTGTSVSNKGEKAYEMLLPLVDSMDIFLASPSADRETRWWAANGLDRILQTIRFMTLYYPIDPDRIFLFGVSDGATGCWTAINCINGPFAGFFAISGFGGMLPSIGCELYTQNISQRPIYNVNAGNDRLYPLDIVNKFLDYMQLQNIKLIRKIYPDEEHGFDYRDKEYGTICNYIRTWSRPSENTISWSFAAGMPNRPSSIINWEFEDAANIRTIHAVFRNDTLNIDVQGISSVTLELPTVSDNLFVKSSNGRIKKLPSINSNYLKLQSKIMQSNPLKNSNHLYQISF